MSRGFLASLAGVAVTIFSWYGPWMWPAWPAFTLIELVYGSHTAFADQTFEVRAAFVVLLIIVNVAVWGGAGVLAMSILDRIRQKA